MHAPFRRTISARPPLVRDGDLAFALPQRLIDRMAEESVAIRLISKRRLFGEVYSALLPEYFRSMPLGSGVFIQSFVPTANISPGADRPGDIDMLIVPYEGDELILEQTLAIEVKVIRANFARQGKSPNEYGFSQARALMDLGFPRVAVAHLIVSDSSPPHAWREMMAVTVLDKQGRVSEPRTELIDCLPADLIDRAFGRLQKAASDDEVGLVAAHVGHTDSAIGPKRTGIWTASHRPAMPNPKSSDALLRSIAEYFEAEPTWWFDTPRFDPPRP